MGAALGKSTKDNRRSASTCLSFTINLIANRWSCEEEKVEEISWKNVYHCLLSRAPILPRLPVKKYRLSRPRWRWYLASSSSTCWRGRSSIDGACRQWRPAVLSRLTAVYSCLGTLDLQIKPHQTQQHSRLTFNKQSMNHWIKSAFFTWEAI